MSKKHQQQSANIRAFLAPLRALVGDNFAEACDHPSTCDCDKCLEFWASMPDEEEGSPMCGPFTREQVEEYRKTRGTH